MSDPGEEVPELSPEARGFLARHQSTGEPSAEALARVQAWLGAPVRAAAPAKRSWLRHEVMAAAAVLLVVVGGQGLFLAYRSHIAPAEGATAEVKAVVNAYRAGDLEGAQRLASQSCREAACAPLASSLAKALGLSRRLQTLSPEELEQLATLDAQLAEGSQTALGLQVARLRQGDSASSAKAEQLIAEAKELKKEKEYEQAAERLQQCVQLAPGNAVCYRMLGSVYAAIGARDQSASDMERARQYYAQFLQVAPPDDEYVPKVKAILLAAADGEEDVSPAPATSVTETEPARAREVYLQGYILRDSNPLEAGRLFREVAAMTAPGDELHQKALMRLLELAAPGAALGPAQISLRVNAQQDVVLTQNIQRVAIGDAAVADVSVVGPRTVRVKGVSRGKTTLLVWLQDGQRYTGLIDVR